VSSSTLLLGGYTTGSGEAFGAPNDQSKGNIDGFITALDPSTGDIVHSKRIDSIELSGNDRVIGLCRDNNTTSTEVFVVGITDGVFDTTYLKREDGLPSKNKNDAFLLKLDLNGMEIVWTRQIGGAFPDDLEVVTGRGPQVHGMACAVTPDGEHVYMAGNVKDDAVLSIVNQTNFVSAGSNDIFVSKFRTDDGTLEFAKQIGSSEEDSLAQGNSLATDAEGGLIVLGNTRGSMYRAKENAGIADIFTMSIGRDGDFIPPLELQAKKGPHDNRYDDGIAQTDPLNYLRYQNSLVAICTLLGLAIILVGVALIMRHQRLRTIEKASVNAYVGGSDGSATTITENISSDRYAARLSNRDSVGGKRGRDRLLYDKKPASYIGSGREISESSGSVISTLGRRKPSVESLRRSITSESLRTKNRRTSKGLKDQENGRSDSNPYGEVYDLLALATKRLSLESDHDYKTEINRIRDKKKGPKQSEEMSLDEIWNLEVL
jgi:hypothetical protein